MDPVINSETVVSREVYNNLLSNFQELQKEVEKLERIKKFLESKEHEWAVVTMNYLDSFYYDKLISVYKVQKLWRIYIYNINSKRFYYIVYNKRNALYHLSQYLFYKYLSRLFFTKIKEKLNKKAYNSLFPKVKKIKQKNFLRSVSEQYL